MGYVIEMVETVEQPTLMMKAVTPVGDLPKILGKAFGDIIGYIMELGEQPIGPAFVGYFNMDMERLEIEIGFPVSKELPGKGENPGRTYPSRETGQLHVQRSLYGNAARL